MNWYLAVLKKYAEFNGRARRSEYWYFVLFSSIITIVLAIIDAQLGTMYIRPIYSVAVLLPTIAVAIRRMHDIGKSGWFILIPIYNLILACTDGDKGTNEYGPDPKSTTSYDASGSLDSNI